MWLSAKHLTVQGQNTPINKCDKLRARFYGPYKIKRWVAPATLELEIPRNVWPIKSGKAFFPVSRVKPYDELTAREAHQAGIAMVPYLDGLVDSGTIHGGAFAVTSQRQMHL